MKNNLPLIFFLLLITTVLFPENVLAQVPSMVCLGNCPTVAAGTAAETAATTTTPTTPPAGTTNTPAPTSSTNTTPSTTPTTAPCSHSVFSPTTNNDQIEHRRGRRRRGGRGGGNNGIIQLLMKLIMQFLQQIMQLLGLGTGSTIAPTSGTTNPTTGPNPTSGTVPTSAGNPTVTLAPCPTNTPASQPTTAQATAAPTSAQTTVAPTAIGPTGGAKSCTSLLFAGNGTIQQTQSTGFNLSDVSTVSDLNALPAGTKGLVWIGSCEGSTASFQSNVQSFAGNPNLFGFYLEDSPDSTGTFKAVCPAGNLKAMSDFIHATIPTAKTFLVVMPVGGEGSIASPSFMNSYNPANTGIDLFGVYPYPCRTELNGCDNSVINRMVAAAIAAGIPQSAIVPIYQAFGGGTWDDMNGGKFIMPNAAQEQQILATWGALVPKPVFDYVYSWGSQNGDTALENSPELQAVFLAHNKNTDASCPSQ